MMPESEFFEAFFASLMATIMGVALGVPIALLINRHVVHYQRRFDLAEKDRRLKDSIDVLIGACKYNIEVLESVREKAFTGNVMHSPDIRLTTWDAVQDIITNSGSNPELLQMLSHHWLRLNRLQKLSDEIFAREIAKSLPTIEDEEMVRQYWQVLHDSAADLAAHASTAIGMLEDLKNELRTR